MSVFYHQRNIETFLTTVSFNTKDKRLNIILFYPYKHAVSVILVPHVNTANLWQHVTTQFKNLSYGSFPAFGNSTYSLVVYKTG